EYRVYVGKVLRCATIFAQCLVRSNRRERTPMLHDGWSGVPANYRNTERARWKAERGSCPCHQVPELRKGFVHVALDVLLFVGPSPAQFLERIAEVGTLVALTWGKVTSHQTSCGFFSGLDRVVRNDAPFLAE